MAAIVPALSTLEGNEQQKRAPDSHIIVVTEMLMKIIIHPLITR
jgi:hypothetical protein